MIRQLSLIAALSCLAPHAQVESTSPSDQEVPGETHATSPEGTVGSQGESDSSWNSPADGMTAAGSESPPSEGLKPADSASGDRDGRPAPPSVRFDSGRATDPVAAIARKPIVALQPLVGKGVAAEEADLIGDALASELRGTDSVRVMERSQVDRILAEQGFQNSGLCNGSECLVQMGQMLGIDQMVVGTVGKLGDSYILNVRLVDVATGEVLRSSSRNLEAPIDAVVTILAPVVAAELVGARADLVGLEAARKDAKEARRSSALPPPVPATPPVVSSSSGGSNAVLWWTAGGIAVAGGAAAALLLLSGDEVSPESQSPSLPSLISVEMEQP